MIRRTLTLTLSLAALAACGRSNEHSASDSAAAATLGPSIDSQRQLSDSGYVAGQQQLDSLHRAGVTPAEGIDSAAVRAGNVIANDPTKDTLVYEKMRVPPKAKP